MKNSYTTAPVEPVNVLVAKPEWARSPETFALYGIKRSDLYALEAEGEIEGVTLRKKGRTKGIKIWNLESVREFIARQKREEQERKNKLAELPNAKAA